ncbi:MAG: 50S ribosomal protein L11 methyltransferase [Pseudomonadota bacterium]
MKQTRFYIDTDKKTAKSLMQVFETAFEEDGFAVAAFENLDAPGDWTVSVYCPTSEANVVETRSTLLLRETGNASVLGREELPDVDWVAATLRDLSSVRAGRYIVHGSHEKDAPKPHEIPILIDAGLAFGTGHHGTTAGCLEMLSRVTKKTKFFNALDLGAGSGVLAIAAAKTMPMRVLASDIDPTATETALYNCRRNKVQASIRCITSTGFNHRAFGEAGRFDLVIANILAKPLQSMALDLALHTLPGGTVILSGLLPHQRARLVSTFRQQGLFFEHAHIRENWLTLVFKKP